MGVVGGWMAVDGGGDAVDGCMLIRARGQERKSCSATETETGEGRDGSEGRGSAGGGASRFRGCCELLWRVAPRLRLTNNKLEL